MTFNLNKDDSESRRQRQCDEKLDRYTEKIYILSSIIVSAILVLSSLFFLTLHLLLNLRGSLKTEMSTVKSNAIKPLQSSLHIFFIV